MKYLLTIATLLLSIQIRAQGLSFAMAREEMLANNLEIAAARQAVEIAQLELRATRGLRLPNLDFVAGYTLMQRDVDIDLSGSKGALSDIAQNVINKGISEGIITPNVANLISEGLSPLLAADWSYTLQKRSTILGALTLTQPIYAGGKINAAIDAAEIASHKAEYDLQAVINNKLSSLVEYYYGVVLAEEAIAVRESVVKGIAQHLEDTRAMEQEGLIAHSEVLYVEYCLADAEQELAAALNHSTLARKALSQVLNRECSEKLTDRIFVVNNIYDIEYYIENTINLNPILLDARSNIALSEQGVKLARSALLPEVAALGGAIVASHNLTTMIPRWSVGIGLRLSLFDGLAKERRYSAAQRANNNLFTIVEDITNKAMLLTEQEYYNTINSLKAVGMIESTIKFAESYLKAKNEGFKEGITPSSELIDAELELQAVRLKQLASAYDFCKYLARLLEVSELSDTLDEYIARAIFIQ